MSTTKKTTCGCSPDKAQSAACCGDETAVDKKHLRIEYLYLDLNTCDRCIGTDNVLDAVGLLFIYE